MNNPNQHDVLCVGMACYDQTFSLDHHPAEDEKTVATNYADSGGGPAANAAITVARLGMKAAFVGYLGNDIYGCRHMQELEQAGVNSALIIRGDAPTSLAVILVKPDGKRALVSYKGNRKPLAPNSFAPAAINSTCVLFDGHEPAISPIIADYCRQQGIPTVLDAGSVHAGTLALLDKVDYLVCSQKFARQYAQSEQQALLTLSEKANTVVVTLGDQGLIWKSGVQSGELAAFSIKAQDTTGAGDTFHGAFAAALVKQMDWQQTLAFSSAAAALCCTKPGARQGIPNLQEVEHFLSLHSLT